MEDDDFKKEFIKAKKQLKDYHTGARKSKPAKKILDLLESQGVISKIEDEFKEGEMVGSGNKSAKISRIKMSNKWPGFAETTGYKGVDLADYGYRKAKAAANPVSRTVSGWFGGSKKSSQSPWISYVKHFKEKHGIPYKEALKTASPSYKQMKAQI